MSDDTFDLTPDDLALLASYKTYIFFREEGWYPVECRDDDEVPEHVALNPGTLKVEDTHGRLVWSLPRTHAH